MTSANAFTTKTLDVSGQTIRAFVRAGRRNSTMRPLLMLNGIGASFELLLPFAEALSPDVEIISFDAPGVGGSPSPALPYSFEWLSKLTAKVLDALGYAEVNVLGLSWGGALAQQFAFDYPDRCKALVLAASATGIYAVPPSHDVLMKMASTRRYSDPIYAAEIAPDIYGGMYRTHPELCEAIKSRPKSVNRLGYAYQVGALMSWTSAHFLSRVLQPTLVLAGNDDPIIPLFNLEQLAQRMPHARLHVIDDGHLFLVTQPEAMGRLVDGFFSLEVVRNFSIAA